MSKAALCAFYDEQLASTEDGVLFSPAPESHHDEGVGSHHFWPRGQSLLPRGLRNTLSFAEGVDPNNGVDVYDKIQSLPQDQQAAISADLDAC